MLAAALLAACHRAPDPLPQFPRLVLWAWERPERLDFLDPRQAGVAFLALTVHWSNSGIETHPRRQPLRVPPSTPLMAVTRLEGDGPPPDAARMADLIVPTAAVPGVLAVEIDFDARSSQRAWYADFLKGLRGKLPTRTPLTMTALASWCLSDPWIRGLPVDDAVPMLFRMGAGQPRSISDFRLPICRSSLGVSTDEIPSHVPRARRVFFFNPHPWTQETYNGAVALARRWQ